MSGGSVEGGLFKAPQPLFGEMKIGQYRTGYSGSSGRSNSGYKEQGGFVFKDFLETMSKGIDRNVKGTRTKTLLYANELGQWDQALGNFMVKYQSAYSMLGGDRRAFYAMYGQDLNKDMANLMLAKTQLMNHSNIIKEEWFRIENSNIIKNKLNPDLPIIDDNGKLQMFSYPEPIKNSDGTYKRNPDGTVKTVDKETPLTVGNYIQYVNNMGWDESFQDYVPPSPENYNNIISNLYSKMEKSHISSSNRETGIKGFDKERVDQFVNQAYDEILADPEARRWFLYNANNKINQLKSINDNSLEKIVFRYFDLKEGEDINLADSANYIPKTTLPVGTLKDDAIGVDITAEVGDMNFYLTEYTRRKLKEQGKKSWNETSQKDYEARLFSAYAENWKANHKAIYTPRLYTEASIENARYDKNKQLVMYLREGNVVNLTRQQEIVSINQEKVREQVNLGGSADMFLDDRKFIKENAQLLLDNIILPLTTKMNISDDKRDLNKTFKMDIDGQERNVNILSYVVESNGIKIDIPASEFDFKDLSLADLQSVNIQYLDENDTKKVNKKINFVDLAAIKGINWNINKSVSEYYKKTPDVRFNSIYKKNTGVNALVAEVPDEINEVIAGGRGQYFQAKSFMAMMPEPVHDSYFAPVPFNGIIVGVKASTTPTNIDMLRRKDNKNGVAYKVVMLVHEDEMEAASKATGINFEDVYEDNYISINTESTGSGGIKKTIGISDNTATIVNSKYLYSDSNKQIKQALLSSGKAGKFYMIETYINDPKVFNGYENYSATMNKYRSGNNQTDTDGIDDPADVAPNVISTN